jgi:hypothetical protein
MSSPQSFVRSPLFAECLARLHRHAPLSVPVEGEYAEQLTRYAAQRAAAVKVEVLLGQLEHFTRAATAMRLDLTLDETEAYVDVALGTVGSAGFVNGEFSGTAFEFDALNADKTGFPALRRDARAYSSDGAPAVAWAAEKISSAHLMHAVHLLTVGCAAQTLVAGLKRHPRWAQLEFFGRVVQGGDREFVCDWPAVAL